MASLLVRKNPKNGFAVATVHYSMDPDKLDEKWLSEARRGISDRAWQREYEIDYSSYAGKPFFPEFSSHNILADDYAPDGALLYRGWDFGFHHPCCVITTLNEFDQWIIVKVILGQDEGIMSFGKRVKNFCLSQFPGSKYIDACDVAGMQMNDKSELTSIQILNSLGIYPQARKQPIKLGAEIIRQKLGMRVDGKVGLLVNPSQMIVIDGFKAGIHYPETREGQPEREFYEKDGYYDHCFPQGTKITTPYGQRDITSIAPGNFVLTRKGWRRVIEKFSNGKKDLIELSFSDGRTIKCTPNHRFWVEGKGWVAADSIRYGTIISCLKSQSQSSLMGKNTTVIQNQKKENSETTLPPAGVVKDCMLLFGNPITAKYQKGSTFTIKMGTLLTTLSQILFSYRHQNIYHTIQKKHGAIQTEEERDWSILERYKSWLKSGIKVQKEKSGILSMAEKLRLILNQLSPVVRSAVRNFGLKAHGVNSAQIIVNQAGGESLESITSREDALSVEPLSLSINMLERSPVLSGVRLVKRTKLNKQEVYDLAVEDQHEYFANGLLVHNCFDSLRYIAVEMFTVIGQQQEQNSIANESSPEQLYRQGSPYNSSDMWGETPYYENDGGLSDFF